MVSGDLLVEARRRAGISQAELGRRSGVPPSLIGRYERYEVIPSFERLRSLIKAAGSELSIRLAKVDPDRARAAPHPRRTAATWPHGRPAVRCPGSQASSCPSLIRYKFWGLWSDTGPDSF